MAPGQRNAAKPQIITRSRDFPSNCFPTHLLAIDMTLIRASRDDDLPAVAAIYAHHVTLGAGDTLPPADVAMPFSAPERMPS